MPLDLTDDKSTLVQVMAWCCQTRSHYLSQCWPRSLSPHGNTRPLCVNSLWASDAIKRHKSGSRLAILMAWSLMAWTNVNLSSMRSSDMHLNAILQNMMTSANGSIFRVTGPFLRGIHRSPMNSPHRGQWRGASMFSLICDWINGWVNSREAGDLRRYSAHYDVIVMSHGQKGKTRKIVPGQNELKWF